jgi:predicted nucleic acid-binding protein
VPFPAVLDANVLIPINTADLLLRLAAAETYRPLWSADILDEVERNLVAKIGLTADKAARRVGMMREAFPDALVTGYAPLIPSMTNDPKDRHVLAAAARAGAAVIVTANLKDFPAPALDPYEITAVSPDDFLLDQFELYSAETLQGLQDMAAARTRPPVLVEELLDRFAGIAPAFANQVRQLLDSLPRQRTDE